MRLKNGLCQSTQPAARAHFEALIKPSKTEGV
jgi:hypothetical protein